MYKKYNMDELIGSLDVEKTLQKNDIVQHIHQLVTPFKICFEWCFYMRESGSMLKRPH